MNKKNNEHENNNLIRKMLLKNSKIYNSYTKSIQQTNLPTTTNTTNTSICTTVTNPLFS